MGTGRMLTTQDFTKFGEFLVFECNQNCFHLSGKFEEEILIGGQYVDNLLIGGGHNVERKWGWVIGGLVMYKVLIGCGENVGFLPINCPHFLGPAKVKQHRALVVKGKVRIGFS